MGKEKFLKELELSELVLKQQPNNQMALASKGTAFINLGRLEEALEFLNKAFKLNPNDYNVINNIGMTLCLLKKYKESIKYFDMCIKLDPKSYMAYNGKGISLFQLQDYKSAVACYNIAIALNPQCYDAINSKSLALAQLGQCEDSFRNFEKMTENLETKQMFLCNKASSLLRSNRYSESILYYDKCMSIKHGTETFKFALFHKTEALFLIDRFKEALSCAEQLIELEPSKKENLYMKGKALQQMERYEEALDVFEKIIKIYPNFSEVVGSVGFCLFKLNRDAESVKYYKRCIKLIDPKDESQREFLSYMKDNLQIANEMVRSAEETEDDVNDFYQILLRFDLN